MIRGAYGEQNEKSRLVKGSAFIEHTLSLSMQQKLLEIRQALLSLHHLIDSMYENG